jgi:hypothetical protein
MAMAKELLEHLIANPSQGVGNCVTISSLKLKLKELEAGL